MDYTCPKCGNKDSRFIGIRNGKPYCRRCVTFNGKLIGSKTRNPNKCFYHLPYSLTDDQLLLSKKLLTNYKKGINSLVFAVCGAGKTEIVLEVIKYAINQKLHVGFAVPRRDVAIELGERFSNIFKNNKVSVIYGGHDEILEGDLIILTTHQLYRYKSYFHLLILDEIDAFPFKNNIVLNSYFHSSLIGPHIVMSATVSKETILEYSQNNNEVLELYSRFHMHPLPVPRVIYKSFLFKYVALFKNVKRFLKENKPLFIFVPTVEECENLYLILGILFKGGNYVHSKRKNRSQIINKFRCHKLKYLVTTAVLERGITVKDLQVIVFHADSDIYNSCTLIQIAGRVGRKKESPFGEVIFISEHDNDEIKECINKIKTANAHLPKVL